MERPSHIHFDSRRFSQRLPLLGLAVCLQVSVAWLLTHELINRRIGEVLPRWIEVDPLQEKQPDKPLPLLPPEPVLTRPDSLPIVAPIFETAPGERSAFNVDQRQTSTIVPTVPPAGPDRAPVSITATHTAPPYPPIERRIGVEGKVTLRLTVNADGRVSEAEVVTSSGREGLDQAAQQWIMAHWTYKPALAKGVAVAGKALATVTFSLTNER